MTSPTRDERPGSGQSFKRKKKLIEPRLQLRFAGLFLSLASAAVLIQAIVIVNSLQAVAIDLPHDGVALTRQIPAILAKTTLLTFGLLVPLSLIIGVRSTFSIVGPLYRFRVYLTAIARGERPGPCRIRKTDDLQDLCAVINEVVDRVHSEEDANQAEDEQEERAA